MVKLWFYFRKLWHEYIVCDIFIMTFSTKLEYGEIVRATSGLEVEVLWEERAGKYWKYWVRPTNT